MPKWCYELCKVRPGRIGIAADLHVRLDLLAIVESESDNILFVEGH